MEDLHARRFVCFILGALVVGQLLAGCGSPGLAEVPALEVARVEAVAAVVERPLERMVPVEPPGWRPGPLDLPDTCDRLTVRLVNGEPTLGKVRASWVAIDTEREREQRRFHALVRLVGDEMGVGPTTAEMLWRIGIRESSGNPASVHVLSADVEANEASSHRTKRIAGAWAEAPTMVYFEKSGRLTRAGTVDGWTIGRGPYGQNTSLFMPRWSLDAPPWALCDPIVATVVAIWSMRAGLEQCKGSTLRDAHRRSWGGQCSPRSPEREAGFDRLARGHVRGLDLAPFDPDVAAELGSRWPEATTDRAELYKLLHDQAVSAGLVAR